MAEIPEDVIKSVPDDSFQVPDLEGHVEGWRCWSLADREPHYGASPKLFSASETTYFWAPHRAMRAACHVDNDHVPGENCTCGFYSARTAEHLFSMSYPYQHRDGHITVVGRVANWGKVIPGTQGWRAEYAYPVEFYMMPGDWKLGARLSRAYGVPVRLANIFGRNLDEMAAEYDNQKKGMKDGHR